MRLINTKTMKLEDLGYKNIPPYTILSHTWGDDEVSHQEMMAGQGREKSGFRKIEGACQLARSRGFEYVWVDTCCIDKTSSAELTEAINSMFNYYCEAYECYALLEDCSEGDDFFSCTASCRWWTRGWTLQELIAPSQLLFYDSEWQYLGTRREHAANITAICHVPQRIIEIGPSIVDQFSVATRLSWASLRLTTRVEDAAYCLLGIFGVNMPLIYGEGQNAFRRLQEEIVKRDNDLTILASTSSVRHPPLLSSKADAFSTMSNLQRLPSTIQDFSITNKGLRFVGACPLSLCILRHPNGRWVFQSLVLWLGYQNEESNLVGIPLSCIGPGLFRRGLHEETYFLHDSSHELCLISKSKDFVTELLSIQLSDLCILTLNPREEGRLSVAFRRLRITFPQNDLFELARVTPQILWDYGDQCFIQPRPVGTTQHDTVMALVLSHRSDKTKVLVMIDCASTWPFASITAGKNAQRLEASLFQSSNVERSLSWTDLKLRHPEVIHLSRETELSSFDNKRIIKVDLTPVLRAGQDGKQWDINISAA